ncbi:hypothetical protein KCTC32516_00458 [Polaribacter huanghezhanensis]|uniref:DUF3667 domain-containing protein n=1 Tax=Polaribacter huanghezhanensis TaxID=1354726 RepID=UPI0026494D55|nr:DUF3667 domain-containing protein [Polaribacter huanghezhanensis]WKD85119.1 hypothetical protein KCTC32516_00458 [Polaribacter huanghezhanensis]
MKVRIRKKSNKPAKILDAECFNCGHPFSGHEKFCPECGQANKDKRITFGSFLHEFFNGFISWDSKFWTTIVPLLTKPGKVSRDYIDGKRQRYANPFRFYLSVSVLFFLMLGATESYDTFKELRTGKTTKNKSLNDRFNDTSKTLDSLDLKSNLKDALKDVDSIKREEILNAISKANLDSLKNKSTSSGHLRIGTFPDASNYFFFQKKHPELDIETALDSLKAEHTFVNRFMYSRFQAVDKIWKNDENRKQFTKQVISYVSISLFVLLPLFTLFLKLFYARRKFTYVEHLIFVFHTQTVFFLLLSLFYLINYIKYNEYITTIFLLLFIIYLFLAMKHFYKQGYFKTFLKFILINISFFFASLFGFVFIALIAFAFY